ncbi:MAG: hypothetical protein U1E56_02120 [Bauldia sp.]
MIAVNLYTWRYYKAGRLQRSRQEPATAPIAANCRDLLVGDAKYFLSAMARIPVRRWIPRCNPSLETASTPATIIELTASQKRRLDGQLRLSDRRQPSLAM